MLRKLIRKREYKLWLRVCRHVRSKYTMIDVEAGNGMFNFRCHDNAVQFAKTHEGYGIAEVLYIDHEQAYLHYVNTKDGKFIDNTLGWRANHLEYYRIRDIHPSDYNQIGAEFNRGLDDWTEQFTRWFDRKLLRIKRIV